MYAGLMMSVFNTILDQNMVSYPGSLPAFHHGEEPGYETIKLPSRVMFKTTTHVPSSSSSSSLTLNQTFVTIQNSCCMSGAPTSTNQELSVPTLSPTTGSRRCVADIVTMCPLQTSLVLTMMVVQLRGKEELGRDRLTEARTKIACCRPKEGLKQLIRQ